MVFLCFSSADRYSVVKSCLYHLKRYGIEVWYDYHELVLGDNKETKNFEYAITSSDYFIIIYSKDFFDSESAIHEEKLIYKEKSRRGIVIFPILYNISLEDMPKEYQDKVSQIIYNEVTDSTGTFNTINQIVSRILLTECGCSENDITPTLGSVYISYIDDKFVRYLIGRYSRIDDENFNAKAVALLLLFKYMTINKSLTVPNYYESIMDYLTDYTNLNIEFNHKEIIILELVVLLCLRKML